MENGVIPRLEQLEAKVDALMNRVASLEGKPEPKMSRKPPQDDDSKKQHP